MSFKNALKNLVAHFGTVWSLLLFILLFAALITGLSLPFVMPIAREFADAGVFNLLRQAFSALLGDGGWNAMWDKLYETYDAIVGVFTENDWMATLTTSFLIVVVVLAFRFFLGLYEIPITTVLDGQMSCNAHYGLGGKFFSTLPVAARYSFAKMLFTILFDVVTGAIINGLYMLIGVSVALPFVIMLVGLVLYSLRFSIVSCWAPIVVSEGGKVAKSFFAAAKLCFKKFASIYSTYFVSLLLIVALGLFISVFTLGVGLVIVFPFCATYISHLNITVFYNKTGRRYYVDGSVFTPPLVSL